MPTIEAMELKGQKLSDDDQPDLVYWTREMTVSDLITKVNETFGRTFTWFTTKLNGEPLTSTCQTRLRDLNFKNNFKKLYRAVKNRVDTSFEP